MPGDDLDMIEKTARELAREVFEKLRCTSERAAVINFAFGCFRDEFKFLYAIPEKSDKATKQEMLQAILQHMQGQIEALL